MPVTLMSVSNGSSRGSCPEPIHHWYYFPAMQMDEALVFKTFDTAVDVPSRESSETRFLAFF